MITLRCVGWTIILFLELTIPGVKEDLEKEIQEALSFFEMHMWSPKVHPRLGFKH